MKLDSVHVVIVTQDLAAGDSGEDDLVAAYLDLTDAEAAAMAHRASGARCRVETIPLAPASGAGIAKNAEEGAHEVDDALNDVARCMLRHNVAGIALALNAFHGAARMHFPTWSTVQANGESVEVRLLEGDPRTDASIDLLGRLGRAMAMQTRSVLRLFQDITQRRGAPRIEVVPGLPPGMQRRP